jgi:hypothetical protein
VGQCAAACTPPAPDPHHWDQFTAVRACLGPVNAYTTTAPDQDLPRLARNSTGYRGSPTLYRYADRPAVAVPDDVRR